MRTKEQCKKIIFDLGEKFKISPKLISTTMLSIKDKEAMLSGEISIVELERYTELWKGNGMPDISSGILGWARMGYRHPSQKLPGSCRCHYNAPFVCADWRNDCYCRLKKA